MNTPNHDSAVILAEKAASYLQYFAAIKPALDRLNKLVQNNPTFFETQPADSCIEMAVRKLEQLVEAEKTERANLEG
jgi:hypothetical protein